MEKLKETFSAQVNWRSYELRPSDGPPISPAYRARIEALRPQMRQMALERYGLEIKEGPFGINSRPALIGAKYAEAQGIGEPYHDAVFRAYWQEAKNIEDLDILAETAVTAGLQRQEFLTALDTPAYQSQVTADIEQAFYYGLSGVPALIFNNQYLVMGAQPYELLAQVAEKVLAESTDNQQ